MRIASLLPSATEIIDIVGGRDELVGISHECDYPPSVAGLPILTRTRERMPRKSGDIDRTVRQILEEAIAVYEIELDRLKAARPDVIVTQDLCDVCAVSIDDVRKALNELAEQDVQIVSLKPETLADVWEDVRRVGRALGRADAGERAATQLAARVADLAQRSAKIEGPRPTVLTIEWLDPIMIGGLWTPELATAAGAEALVTSVGEHAPTLDLQALRALDPDVVLIKPCGFDIARTAEELSLLRDNLPWNEWRCVQEGRVYLTDGNAYFNRPGPRLVESGEILAACVHPKGHAELSRKHSRVLYRIDPGLSLVSVGS